VQAVPDGEGRLSEGVLVDASIVAHLFGVKPLRLRADVVLVAAAVVPASPTPRPYSAPLRALPRVNGTGDLADAVRLVKESAERIDRTRR